jgi:hypothetical protein
MPNFVFVEVCEASQSLLHTSFRKGAWESFVVEAHVQNI